MRPVIRKINVKEENPHALASGAPYTTPCCANGCMKCLKNPFIPPPPSPTQITNKLHPCLTKTSAMCPCGEEEQLITSIIDKRITQHEDNAFVVLNQILEELKEIKQKLDVQQDGRVV
jgi:hypothetical protein